LDSIPATGRRVPHADTAGKASVLPAVSAPILRVLCEGWGTQLSPFDLTRKADLFLRRPGFHLVMGPKPEHPAFESETWTTHSIHRASESAALLT
jgi:hypothetical protein